MMPAGLRLAQAVVTDPEEVGSAGYVLTGRSPALLPEDADFLSMAPGVSDYLSSETNPRSFYSFFALPSGRFAFSRRFVSGTRRHGVNRIVAHTLVLSASDLQALNVQPWLLVARCRFRLWPDAPNALSLAELGDAVAKPGTADLPDLDVEIDAPAQASRELTRGWRRALVSAIGRTTLEERLAWLFATLISHRRVAAEQKLDWELVLALAWSLLPLEDRKRCYWTTHFAPGVPVQFMLSNAADLDGLRRSQADLATPPPTLPALMSQPSITTSVADLLARVAASDDGDDLAELYGPDASLVRESDRLVRKLYWASIREQSRQNGCSTVESFQQHLDLLVDEDHTGLVSWAMPKDVLAMAVRTVVALGGETDRTLTTIYQCLAERGIDHAVFFASPVGFSPEGDGPAHEGLIALNLLTRYRGISGAELQSVIQAWRTRGLSRESRNTLMRSLLHLASTGRLDDVLPLAQMSFSSEELAFSEAQLESTFDFRKALFVLAMTRVADPTMFRRVAQEQLLPFLLTDPERALEIPWQLQRSVYDAVLRIPDACAHAFERFPPKAAAVLAEYWRKALDAGDKDALGVAHSLARQNHFDDVCERHRLDDAWVTLRTQGADVHTWVTFAGRRARVLDAAGDVDAIAQFVKSFQADEMPTHDAREAFQPVMAALARAAVVAPPGECVRVMVAAVGDNFDMPTRFAVEALAAAIARGGAALMTWEPLVRRAIAAFPAHPQADVARTLRVQWWSALAASERTAPPDEAFVTLDGARPDEVAAIVEAWVPRFRCPDAPVGTRNVLVRLRRMASQRRDLLAALTIASSIHDLLIGDLTLVDTLNRIARDTPRGPFRAQTLATHVGEVLEAVEKRDAGSVIALLIRLERPRIAMSVLDALDRVILPPLLTGDPSVWPPLQDVVRWPTLPFRLADEVARTFADVPDWSVRFVSDAVALRRFDLVARCLRRTRETSGRRTLLDEIEAQMDRGVARAIRRAARDPGWRRDFAGVRLGASLWSLVRG